MTTKRGRVLKWKKGPPPDVQGVYLLQMRGSDVIAGVVELDEETETVYELHYSYYGDPEVIRHLGPFKSPPTSMRPR